MSHGTLWYVDRASGLVALALLSATVVLGLVSAARLHSPRWPRFALALLHRNLALLALTFGTVHVLTTVLDSFVPIRAVDAFVPFVSAYKPVWVGVGAIGVDLMLAVLLTSALRRRLGYQRWKTVHMLSYGCWGASLVHALAIGSDARTAIWGVTIVAACVGAVGGAFVQKTLDATPH